MVLSLVQLVGNLNKTDLFHVLDGRLEFGDGTTRGTCPTNPSNLLCHSDGHCNVCRYISPVHVGCNAMSSTPICDADSTTLGIEDTAVEKRSACVACKKVGTSIISIILLIQWY